jgi:hypothetical protein
MAAENARNEVMKLFISEYVLLKNLALSHKVPILGQTSRPFKPGSRGTLLAK